MALNQSFVGREYPPGQPYEVGREKIREFAEAVGDGDAAYRDPQAARKLGYPDVIAPPTFPATITMAACQRVFDDPELGLDYARVVHGDQRFRYTRPVVAGDRLHCRTVIEEITSRGGHDFITLRCDVAADGGEPVVAAWAKLVVRGEE